MTAATEPVMPRMVCQRCKGSGKDPVAIMQDYARGPHPANCIICGGSGSLPVTLTAESAVAHRIGAAWIRRQKANLNHDLMVQRIAADGALDMDAKLDAVKASAEDAEQIAAGQEHTEACCAASDVIYGALRAFDEKEGTTDADVRV